MSADAKWIEALSIQTSCIAAGARTIGDRCADRSDGDASDALHALAHLADRIAADLTLLAEGSPPREGRRAA